MQCSHTSKKNHNSANLPLYISSKAYRKADSPAPSLCLPQNLRLSMSSTQWSMQLKRHERSFANAFGV
eukprot:200453-Pelagomonas_calceolata.AAC.4